MRFYYDLGDTNFWVYYDSFFDTIDVFQIENATDYDDYFHSEKLSVDENGKKYFHFNGIKIYFDDYEYIPYNQWIELFYANKKYLSEDDFICSVLKAGVENIVIEYPLDCCDFIVGEMGICSGKTKMVRCKITERKYRIISSYKIELVAEAEDKEEVLCYKSFYLSDFLSLMKKGQGRFLPIKEND